MTNNTIIFQVDRPQNLIHSVSAMTITNKGGSFSVYFRVNWNQNPNTYTEFDYRNVPKDKVFWLVTSPSWVSNGTKVFAHDVDVSVLKEFIR